MDYLLERKEARRAPESAPPRRMGAPAFLDNANGPERLSGLTPIPAAAAPAQGVSWWKLRKMKRRAKKEAKRYLKAQDMEAKMHEGGMAHYQAQVARENMHTDAMAHYQAQVAREKAQTQAQIQANKERVDPRLHKYVTDPTPSNPSWNLERQKAYLDKDIAGAAINAYKLRNVKAFAKQFHPDRNIMEKGTTANRRIEALYALDSEGGMGKHKEYNLNMFNTLKDYELNGPGSYHTEDTEQLKTERTATWGRENVGRLTQMLEPIVRLILQYKDTEPQEITQEYLDNPGNFKVKMGMMHAFSDIIRSLSSDVKQQILRDSGYDGTIEELNAINTRVNMSGMHKGQAKATEMMGIKNLKNGSMSYNSRIAGIKMGALIPKSKLEKLAEEKDNVPPTTQQQNTDDDELV